MTERINLTTTMCDFYVTKTNDMDNVTLKLMLFAEMTNSNFHNLSPELMAEALKTDLRNELAPKNIKIEKKPRKVLDFNKRNVSFSMHDKQVSLHMMQFNPTGMWGIHDINIQEYAN